MKRTVSLFQFMPYGAPELLAARETHLASALAVASLLALAAFLAALPLTPLLRSLPEPEIRIPAVIVETNFPPTLVPPEPPKAATRASHAAREGVVVPVPPSVAPPDDIVWNDAPSSAAGPASTSAAGEPEVRDPGPAVYEEPPRGVWQPVDELPAPATEVKPEYPSLARDAGVEGLVVVDVLIGTNGRVIRAELVRDHSVPMLDPYALEAARRWTFRPAISGGHAVPYWFRIPFRFVLHE